MQPQELEPEVELFFLRLVPDLALHWKGATEDEIARLEAIAGRPLPRFYRWFLLRMGKSVGPLQFRSLDFSVQRILSCYADGLVEPDPQCFMIGFETDNVMPLHLFYDFDHSIRDDARVITMDFEGGPIYEQFDTFREMLTWGQFTTLRINRLPQSCAGLFKREALDGLDVVMKGLGFAKPVSMGANCAIYERSDAAMSVFAAREEPLGTYASFRFGAADWGRYGGFLGSSRASCLWNSRSTNGNLRWTIIRHVEAAE